MKTVTLAKISVFCLSLFCLGMSQANDTNTLKTSNDIKTLMSASEDAIMKNPNINNSTKQEANKLEGFIQNTIAGQFTYAVRSNQGETKFTYLSANRAFANKELFSLNESYDEKLKKVKQMQSVANHIAETHNVKLSMVEEIVLTTVIEAEKKDLSPALLLSLIGVESTFKPTARSGMGAIGLTQVIPKWHPEKIQKIGNANNLNTVKGSIVVGVEVLAEYLEKAKGNLRVALQMYNGSLGDKSNKYSKKVFAGMETYSKFFES